MIDEELAIRFDHLRDYVDAAVTVPSTSTTTASGQHARAPHVQHWRGSRRFALPVLAAVSVAILAITVTVTTQGRAARHAAAPLASASAGLPLSCPKSAPTASSPTDLYPLPRAGSHPLTVTDQLVPSTTPVHAVVCAYVLSRAQPPTGSRVIDTDLTNIPATLGFAPPQPGQTGCTFDLESTDRDLYLIGLTYPSGTLWISAPGNHCLGSSNGHFIAGIHVAAAAIQAYATGTWASARPSPAANACSTGGSRLGQQNTMVPGTPVALGVCRESESGQTTTATATDTETAAITAALNHLPTEPDALAFKCAGQGFPSASYTLTFQYSIGPSVTVSVEQDCSPAIFNGNLQATDDSKVLPIIQQILTH